MTGTSDIDGLCINTIRTLSMDAVQAANSGHPGAPMALAPVAYWKTRRSFSAPLPGVIFPMSCWSSRSLFLSAVAFVACAGGFGTSSIARAGCGDYVHLGQSAPQSETARELLSLPSDTGPFEAPDRSRPCQGSSCRQTPIVPLEPAPLPVSQGPDQKACLASEAESPRLACGWLQRETTPSRADRCGWRIERPPRNCSL